MANRLEITKQYLGDAWRVTSTVVEPSDVGFPQDIFLWTLKDDGSLDAFQAIGHVDQLARFQAYDSNRTSNFGIHLVKYTESSQLLQSEVDADKVITVLKAAFDLLTKGFDEETIPVVEIYPPVE